MTHYTKLAILLRVVGVTLLLIGILIFLYGLLPVPTEGKIARLVTSLVFFVLGLTVCGLSRSVGQTLTKGM